MTAPGNRRADRPLRVAVVTTNLWSGANTLWQGAAEQGADVLLIGSERTRRDEIEADGLERVSLPEVDLGRGLIWRHLRGLRSRLKAFDPDLVHVNGELWSITVQELVGLPIPVVPHGAENLWSHGGDVEQKIRHLLVERALRLSAGYASWNHAGRDYVSDRVAPSFPLLVMPAIVPPPLFHQSSWSPAPGRSSALDILLVGRLIPLKDFTTVLRAVALLPPGTARVRICGEGPERQAIEALAGELGIDVEFLGRRPPETLVELMTSSSVLIQPSVSTPDNVEQFGRAVAEAMTLGLPCIVSDSGELPFVVGEEPAAIFPEGDHTQLAARLTALTESTTGLADLSTRQRQLATAYSPAVAGRRVLEFWQQVAQGARCA